jgi:hypothetical protein
MDTTTHRRRGETSMTLATSLIEIPETRILGGRCALESVLGLAIMRQLRRAAILLLDMRTEFEILAPGDTTPAFRNTGLTTVVGQEIARRVRQVASTILDPWAEFESLD